MPFVSRISDERVVCVCVRCQFCSVSGTCANNIIFYIEMTADIFNSLFNTTVLVAVCVGGCILVLMYITYSLRQQDENQVKNATRSVCREKVKEASVTNNKTKKKTVESRWTRSSDKHNFTHPWLLTSLKGHTGQVLDMDFSSTGKYLASCADDRTVVLWCTKDLTQKDQHRCLRVNVNYDYATRVKWSPDSRAVIVHRATDNTAEVYKVERKANWLGPAVKGITYPKVHEEDIVGMDIACNGRFIMSCSAKNDMVLFDLRGTELARVDTYLMHTWCARISPCGRYIVASGFAPDVKIWEVCFNKTGEFMHTKRAFELSGHTSGVYDFAFDMDTSHIATVSKDGTWKIYETNIEYNKGEDAHLKITGKYKHNEGSQVHIALSPNSEVVVISVDDTLRFYSVHNGTLDQTINNIYTNGPITSLMFDSLGKYVLTSGEKHIRVFHNVTGYRCSSVSAQEKLKQKQTSATIERLQTLIAENEAFLNAISTK